MSDPTPNLSGRVLAERYALTTEIGRGGFGVVYQARQLNMDREVAIKILPPQFMAIPDVVERFKREAQLCSRLQHPNTITIHDYGQHEGLLYIVMEYLRGEDLADLLKRERTIAPQRILAIAKQVLRSLSEAHSHGIVHRDLKPENIFLTQLGEERDVVKVLDFGIAKLAMPGESADGARQLTMSGSTVGTPVYMSPEQAAGEPVDAQTDLYALGIIMYELACGKAPFNDRNPIKVMRQHLFEPIPPLPDPALRGTLLERIINRALQKDKPLRYLSAQDFIRDMDQALTPPRLAAQPARKLPAPPPRLTPPLSAPAHDEDDDDDEDEPITTEVMPTSPPHTRAAQETAGFEHAPRHPLVGTDENRAARHPLVGTDENRAPRHPLVGTDENRARAPHEGGARVSALRQTPPGSRRDGMSGVSSIITVVEAPPEEEVILLTTPKRERAPSPPLQPSTNPALDARRALAHQQSQDISSSDLIDAQSRRPERRLDATPIEPVTWTLSDEHTPLTLLPHQQPVATRAGATLAKRVMIVLILTALTALATFGVLVGLKLI